MTASTTDTLYINKGSIPAQFHQAVHACVGMPTVCLVAPMFTEQHTTMVQGLNQDKPFGVCITT